MYKYGQLLFLIGWMLCSATVLAVDKVQVLALFPGKAMLSIDGRQHVLANGSTSPEGVQLIAATPNEATVVFNGEKRVLKLGSAVNASYRKERPMEVRIVRDNTGAFIVAGTINGRSVRFLVDTGANVIAMSENEARRLNIPYQVSGKPGNVSTAGGAVQAWAVVLKSVNVGEISLTNIAAVVLKGSNPPTTLLGMSFLGRLQVQHGNNLMTLSKR